MLALHAVWAPGDDEGLLVWAEDGALPAAGPPVRGRRPATPRPRRHPFAATADALREALADLGSASTLPAAAAQERSAVLWLPGRPEAPVASPELLRTVDLPTPRRGGGTRGASGPWPFVVPALHYGPSAALDVLLALTTGATPGRRAGASVLALARVAGLALEAVAGGRVLPDLVAAGDGRHLARWAPLGGGRDDERLRAVAAALPPLCRALGDPDGADPFGPVRPLGQGADPWALVLQARAALVDAACRDALRRARRSLLPAGWRPGTTRLPAAEWLEALADEDPEVLAEPGELVKLDRSVAEWRAGAAGRGGPWRLCFRLREPASGEDGAEDEAAAEAGPGAGPGLAEEGPWRVDLLLQATDDRSLVVEAAEVWRAPDTLQRAARSLDAPHEVLLAELGRAVRAYPELGEALREPAPTGLELDLEGAHRFLAEVAPALEVAGFGVLLPSWWRRPSARLGVRARASATGGKAATGGGLLGQDGLCQFDWEAALGDQALDLAELRRLADLKSSLVRVRGQWVELRPGEAARLVEFLTRRRSSAERSASVGEVVRLASGAATAVDGVPLLGVEADGALGALLRGELERSLAVRPTPAGFCGQLRPYQERGVAWLELLEASGLGACLADDMGLGKTATVLALLAGERNDGGSAPGPTLVVCPTSVVGNWQREAARFTPDLQVYVHHGARRAKGEALAASATAADLVVTSYPLVERDRTAMAGVHWRRVVLDEAQNVKNPEAKQTRAVRALRAGRRVALSGTPVENHLGELWSLMEILNPGLLGSAASFREHFAVPIERFKEEDAAARLRALTQPFVLRRVKTDRAIISDLPDKLEMKVVCTLTREQATLYQAVVDEMLRRIEESEGIERRGLVLATMLRLKQVCNHPAQYLGDGSAAAERSGKLERTVELLDEVRDGGEKALVFTQFAEMGAMLQEHLRERLGCQVAFLHGGVARRRRDEMVEAFQAEDDAVPIMVLSLKAGGTGLNLTAANHVVHFDRWWNPAVEDQATDRAFRIGQRRDVQVRKLVCAGTLEDRIDGMIEAKRDLAERIVGTGEAWLTELSTEELADVLRLSAETVGDR